jgi:hypothetical protein
LAGVNDRLLLSVAPGRRDRRALEIVDLACVKINQPQPWTPATLRLGWSQRTDIRRILVLPGASVDLGRVPGATDKSQGADSVAPLGMGDADALLRESLPEFALRFRTCFPTRLEHLMG